MALDIIVIVMYYNHRINKGVNKMARKNKNGDKHVALQAIVLITAILNLVKALIDLIGRLTE